jgi:ADP-heptose:LPS heptosyltransferase/organic radical activating enzyme
MIKEIMKRTIFTHLPPNLPTSIVFFIQGGMGDRIIFQGIIKDLMANSPQKRIIAAIPFYGDDYSAHNYVPKPDEVWIVDFIKEPDLARRLQVPKKVRRYADEKLFLSHKENETYYFGSPGDPSLQHLYLDWIKLYEPFRYYKEFLVNKNIFPEFPIYPEELEKMTEEFKGHHLELGQDKIIAVHCRQRKDAPDKNPDPEDFIQTIKLLKKYLKAKIVLLGVDDIPDELKRQSSFICPFDRTLKLTAAALSLCDLFIGGDSGPGHLAAAVGIPIISIQNQSRAGKWGPFCSSDHLKYVSDSIGSKEKGEGTHFDPNLVFALAKGSLDKNHKKAQRSVRSEEIRELPPERSFSWDRLLYIVDFLDNSNIKAISLSGREPASQPYFVDFMQYLQKRGFHVETHTSGIIGENKIKEMIRFFQEASSQELSFCLDIDDTRGLFFSEKISLLRNFLDNFNDKTRLSFRIRDPNFDLDLALFFIEQYQLPRKIRIEVAAQDPHNISDIIKRLMSFARFYRQNRIILDFDWCLPYCLFSEKELMFLYRVSQGDAHFGCPTSLELIPDMKIRPCFHASFEDISERSIYDFNSLQEARDSFKEFSGKIKKQELCRIGKNKSCFDLCLAHLSQDLENETIIKISGSGMRSNPI